MAAGVGVGAPEIGRRVLGRQILVLRAQVARGALYLPILPSVARRDLLHWHPFDVLGAHGLVRICV